jgi:hypothetical protein
VPEARRAGTTAAELALDDEELVVDEHQDVAELLEGPAFQRVGRAVVTTTKGGVGILSITDVNRARRALDLQKAAGARARPV